MYFTSLQFKITILEGEFIRVFVEAVDVMGNNANDSLYMGVTSSPPRFVERKLDKTVDSSDPQLPHSSRFVLLMRVVWLYHMMAEKGHRVFLRLDGTPMRCAMRCAKSDAMRKAMRDTLDDERCNA